MEPDDEQRIVFGNGGMQDACMIYKGSLEELELLAEGGSH